MPPIDPNAPPPPDSPDLPPPPAPGGTSWGTILQYIFFSALGIAALVVIFMAVSGRGGFLGSLNQYETARGLITFLIAFTTVALAVILVLASIISSSPDLKARFELGREVFTSLVGILGTIVGFYFATAGGVVTDTKGEANPAASPSPAASPAPASLPAALPAAPALTVRVSDPTPRRGEAVVINAFVHAGTPPYTYSVKFDSDAIPSVTGASSPDGFIRETVVVPAGYTPGAPLRFRIDVRDAAGRPLAFDHGASAAIKAVNGEP